MAKRLAELTIDDMAAKVKEVEAMAARIDAIKAATEEAGLDSFISDGHGRFDRAIENLHLFAEAAELYLKRAIRDQG